MKTRTSIFMIIALVLRGTALSAYSAPYSGADITIDDRVIQMPPMSLADGRQTAARFTPIGAVNGSNTGNPDSRKLDYRHKRD